MFIKRWIQCRYLTSKLKKKPYGNIRFTRVILDLASQIPLTVAFSLKNNQDVITHCSLLNINRQTKTTVNFCIQLIYVNSTTKTWFYIYTLGYKTPLVPGSGTTCLGYHTSWFLSRWHHLPWFAPPGSGSNLFILCRYWFQSVRKMDGERTA